MGTCYILIAVSLLNGVSSSYGSQDQVITTSVGKTATLQCQIANQGSDLRSLYWKKDGSAIFSRTSDGEYTNGKYSVTGTASLVIPDVTESDVGNYSCIVAFRKSFGTKESDIVQLYVIDVSVSHCKDTGQEVDGCSCSINGSSITSLECSASGFPHPPVITWEEEDIVIYQSSSINLTRFRENITLTCKASDGNLNNAVENKTVCVHYAPEVTSTGGSPVEVTTISVIVRACIAVIVVLSIALILLLLERYIRKKGKAFQWYKKRKSPKTLEEPDEPPLHGKDIGANDAGRVEPVLNVTSNWINNATLQRRDECEVLITEPESQEVTDESQIPAYQGNRVIQSLPMAAMSSSVVAFNPRPYFLRGELQSSVRAAMNNVISGIIPDGPVTGHSGLMGNSYLDFSTAMFPYLPMQSNTTSTMASSSAVACNPLSSALLWEPQSSESAAICNTTTSIFRGFDLERWHSGLRGNICLICSNAMSTSSVSDSVE